MRKAYSNDLRERVVFAVEAGEATRSVAIRFGIAISTVVKLAALEYEQAESYLHADAGSWDDTARHDSHAT